MKTKFSLKELSDLRKALYVLLDEEDFNNQESRKKVSNLITKVNHIQFEMFDKLEGFYKMGNGQVIRVEVKGGKLVDENNVEIDEEELKLYQKV